MSHWSTSTPTKRSSPRSPSWNLIDPTTWQFDLCPGVRFHDGTPFTSEDVVFSMRRATSSTSDFKSALSLITAVEAADDLRLRITTADPNLILPDQLNRSSSMSKRWAEQHDALLPVVYGEKVTYAEHHANGTGPFKLVSFELGVGRCCRATSTGGGSARILTTSMASCTP